MPIGVAMRALHAIVLLFVIVAATAVAARFVPPPQSVEAALPRPVGNPPRESEQKPAFDVRQAPVPMLWTYTHQAIATPEQQTLTANTVVIPFTPAPDSAQAVTGPADQPDDQTADQARMGQANAKAAIEADGYKDVTDLVQAPDGRWTAHALRGATLVHLTVAADGRVSAN